MGSFVPVVARGFVCASGGWLQVVCWFGFSLPFGFGVVVVSAALFWAVVSLLWSAAGAVYCSPVLMRCLLGGQPLHRLLPEVVATDVELLGSCSMVSRRGLLPKEAGRVDACKRALVLLACARLPFERCMRACRQFAVSKVAYGWNARAPPLTLCCQLWSCIHVGSRRLRSAAVWLRAALWGGGMHLDILFATRLIGIFCRLRKRVPCCGAVPAVRRVVLCMLGLCRTVGFIGVNGFVIMT